MLNGPHNTAAASLSNRGLMRSGPDAFVTLRFHRTSFNSCSLISITSRAG